MPLYIRNGTGWQELTGTDQPYIHNDSGWQGVKEVHVHDGTGWRLSYQYDSTGPTSTTPTASRVSAGTTMTVSYGTVSDTESGVAAVYLYRRYINGGITYPNANGELRATIYNSTPVASVAGSLLADTIESTIRRTPSTSQYTVQYSLLMVDGAGNTTSTAWSTAVPTKPLGTFTINATQTSTWETGSTPSWRTDTQDVVSGFFDSVYNIQTGYWFYGSALQNLCVGYTPNSATIFMQRNASLGTSGSNNISPHEYASRPASGAPTTYMTNNEDVGPNLTGSDASTTYTLPSGWRTLMGNGTMYGVAAVDSGSYRRLRGIDTQAASGRLTIGFT